jgi:hypothetical protein
MKTKNKYNRFILYGNAITCVCGNKIIRTGTLRGKFSWMKKVLNFFLCKMNV